jgi:phosphoglycerol transferase MdoB-like AlkP superfamily enzyme
MSKVNKIKTNIIKLFSWLAEKRKNQKNITVIIFSQLYLFFLAFCITFFIFSLLRGAGGGAEIGDIIPRALVSWLIILIICEFFYLTAFFLYAPLLIVYPILTFASVVNVAKINFRNEPFVFTDLLILQESFDIASQYPTGIGKHLPFLIPVFILLLILPLLLRRMKIKILKRVISGSAALVLTAAFFAHALISDDTLIEKTAHQSVWNLAHEYRQNGFVLAFMQSIKRSLMFSPPDYNRTNAGEFALALGYPENYIMPPLNKTREELPNIIVIMNEAYWDTANLTGIAFNRDPLGAARGIMEQNGSPGLLTPHIGGGTANIEFEFLTGKNIVYYPPAAMVYQQFVTKKHWSLAWYFRDFGYATTAIHPYYDWFWKRNTVYPLLGFENIFFDNGGLNYIDRRGRYISDQAVSWEIISRYNRLSDNGGIPVFTFAVTMQNHGPYSGQYGNDTQISLINQLDEHHARMIETYAEGVRYASEAFMYLTEYFKDTERPTYIIMFGDHSPSGIVDMAELYAYGEHTNMTEQVLFNRYVTPVIIWTNFDCAETDEAIRNIGTVTPQMLTNEIFNITGMPKPAYMQMLENIKRTTRGFTRHYILDADGGYHVSGDFERIRDIYEKMRVVQYDATLGRGYFADEFDR